ncbi:MAG: hypothetical protein J1E83_01090 [Lachnospiraceae bacterium]|nr:hypothetical protein [Lachnospiraceae bacterium]
MNLLYMSLAGAVMILFITVIRALTIHKLPKKTFLVLWGVAVVRLLIPYSLRSAFSFYSLLAQFTPTTEAVKDMPAVPFTPMVPVNHMTPLPAASAGNTATVFVNPWIVVWMVGALACAAFFAMAYLKCHREFKASLPTRNEHVELWLSEHRIHRNIEIRQSGRISAPLTYGVFRPVILMPKTADWDDLDTLKYVLAHEYVHIRRFDAVTKLVLTAALCVHWFNPAVWLMYVLANRDIELSCDEAVIRKFGECTKSAYAMTLIRMEETRSSLTPLCNNFSKNAIEERIVAIMKIKKTSLVALTAATVLVVGVTTAFATSAKTDEDLSTEDLDRKLDATDTYIGTDMLTSYVDPRDGKTYYSFDGGKTFEPLTDEEFEALFPSPKVEWWTYDEYKAWLENEKVLLQEMIGEWGWTSGRGEFIWTQEMVDETIAMYEGILADIGRGMLYSKTVYGEGDLFGMSFAMSYNPTDIAMGVHEGTATAADFSQYAPYGLTWDEAEHALFWNGQRVRYFLDGVDLDGTGAMAIRLEYADTEFVGEIDVHTVRERVENADGSFDPMGPLTGLEKYSQAEFDARSFLPPSMDAVTDMTQDFARNEAETEALLQAYVPFGLVYQLDVSANEQTLSMSWQGKPVHSIFDGEKGVWIANSMRGLYLGPDAVDLEAVYERGKLTGLQEMQSHATTEISFVAEGTAAAESGTSFTELFEKYASFGITYVEAEGASGAGNVYYNGQLVSRFADLTPDGGAFTFSSAESGGITVKTIYDNNGGLTGVETVAE